MRKLLRYGRRDKFRPYISSLSLGMHSVNFSGSRVGAAWTSKPWTSSRILRVIGKCSMGGWMLPRPPKEQEASAFRIRARGLEKSRQDQRWIFCTNVGTPPTQPAQPLLKAPAQAGRSSASRRGSTTSHTPCTTLLLTKGSTPRWSRSFLATPQSLNPRHLQPLPGMRKAVAAMDRSSVTWNTVSVVTGGDILKVHDHPVQDRRTSSLTKGKPISSRLHPMKCPSFEDILAEVFDLERSRSDRRWTEEVR